MKKFFYLFSLVMIFGTGHAMDTLYKVERRRRMERKAQKRAQEKIQSQTMNRSIGGKLPSATRSIDSEGESDEESEQLQPAPRAGNSSCGVIVPVCCTGSILAALYYFY